MAIKDYKWDYNQCIVKNHSEFCKLMKWFLRHGAEDCRGKDIPMFYTMWDMLDDLNVNYINYTYESNYENGDDDCLIKNISELEEFLKNNIDETLVPSEDEYPVLVQWHREENYSRVGNEEYKIFIMTSMSNIKNMNEYLIGYTQELRKERNKWRVFDKIQH